MSDLDERAMLDEEESSEERASGRERKHQAQQKTRQEGPKRKTRIGLNKLGHDDDSCPGWLTFAANRTLSTSYAILQSVEQLSGR